MGYRLNFKLGHPIFAINEKLLDLA